MDRAQNKTGVRTRGVSLAIGRTRRREGGPGGPAAESHPRPRPGRVPVEVRQAGSGRSVRAGGGVKRVSLGTRPPILSKPHKARRAGCRPSRVVHDPGGPNPRPAGHTQPTMTSTAAQAAAMLFSPGSRLLTPGPMGLHGHHTPWFLAADRRLPSSHSGSAVQTKTRGMLRRRVLRSPRTRCQDPRASG